MGKIDIYITTCNRIECLKIMVASVLRQTFSDYNLYILDNCSSDGTEHFISSIQDTRIHYIRHGRNIGGTSNLNYAFEHCDSNFFCVFHDDDIAHCDLIEKELQYMEQHEECAAVSCLADNIDETGKIIWHCPVIANQSEKIYSDTDFFKTYLSRQKSFIFPATMYRNDFIKRNKIALKEDPGPCRDVVLYMDIEKAGGVLAEIQRPMFDYRIHSNQDSFANLEKMLIQLMQYLSQDPYYSMILNKCRSGKESYYRWYAKKLLIRAASKAIANQTADKYLKEMKTVLGGSGVCYWSARTLLYMEKMLPGLFENGYRSIKSKQR